MSRRKPLSQVEIEVFDAVAKLSKLGQLGWRVHLTNAGTLWFRGQTEEVLKAVPGATVIQEVGQDE